MDTKQKMELIGERLMRKDALDAELARIFQLNAELVSERDTIDDELVELLGIKAEPATNGERKQRTCSQCGEKGHNKKGCPQLKEA